MTEIEKTHKEASEALEGLERQAAEVARQIEDKKDLISALKKALPAAKPAKEIK